MQLRGWRSHWTSSVVLEKLWYVPCKHLWVKLITKASLSTEMLQTTAVLDVFRGRKESHRIIIEVILIMMALYGLIYLTFMASYHGIMTVSFTRSTENCKMKANDANYSITIDGNDYEWIIILLYLYGSVRKQQADLQQPSQLSGWDTRRGEGKIPLKVGKHIGP